MTSNWKFKMSWILCYLPFQEKLLTISDTSRGLRLYKGYLILSHSFFGQLFESRVIINYNYCIVEDNSFRTDCNL